MELSAVCPLKACKKSGECVRYANFLKAKAEKDEYMTINPERVHPDDNGCEHWLVERKVKVGWNQKYCTAPGKGVENITFRNVRYTGKLPNISIITGYNEERGVKNITFESLNINGRIISDTMPGKPPYHQTADYVPMFVGSHVKNIKFK